MTIDRGTVQHMARLAELAVTDADADALAEQLDRIVRFVEQLTEVGGGEATAGGSDVIVGPPRTPLREDVVAPIAMTHRPAEFAPAMRDGLFLVPRLGGMTDA